MSEPPESGMTPEPELPPIIWIPYDIADEPEIVGRTADGRPIYRAPEGPTTLDRVREHLDRKREVGADPGEEPTQDAGA